MKITTDKERPNNPVNRYDAEEKQVNRLIDLMLDIIDIERDEKVRSLCPNWSTAPKFIFDEELSRAWEGTGAECVARGLFEEAVKYFTLAIFYNPYSQAAWDGVGKSLYNSKKFAWASKMYLKALTVMPECESFKVERARSEEAFRMQLCISVVSS